jgi:type IV pilus biogenesis protein CpaD/CtpE
MRIAPILPLLLVSSAALSACAHNTDLVAKLNAEPLGNTNQSNIAAMVVNPADLVHGHGSNATTDNAVTVLPIERHDGDHEKTLLKQIQSGGGAAGG